MNISILDRLLDGSFGDRDGFVVAPGDAPEALRRDLEFLLNTRNHFGVALADDWPEASRSVLAYGLADAEECMLANGHEIEELRAKVERSLAVFEPRLEQVEVRVLEAPRPMTQEVVLEIRGVLKLNAEDVIWNSTLRGSVVVVRKSEGS